MISLKRMPGVIYLTVRKVRKAVLRLILSPLFAECGTDVSFDPDDQFSYRTIHIGNHVFIGKGACFSAKKSINIGNKVMFGPNVTVMGGDHNYREVGHFMFDVKQKRPTDDMPVVIEDDVWVGTGVIILKGCTIHTGSIIAAGAIVTNDVPAYSIVGGVPAKVIKMRWNDEELLLHKKLINNFC